MNSIHGKTHRKDGAEKASLLVTAACAILLLAGLGLYLFYGEPTTAPDYFVPFMVTIVGVLITGVFVFATFRIDRGAREEARTVAEEAIRDALSDARKASVEAKRASKDAAKASAEATAASKQAMQALVMAAKADEVANSVLGKTARDGSSGKPETRPGQSALESAFKEAVRTVRGIRQELETDGRADPDVELFLAVLEHDEEAEKRALDAGAKAEITLGELFERYGRE